MSHRVRKNPSLQSSTDAAPSGGPNGRNGDQNSDSSGSGTSSSMDFLGRPPSTEFENTTSSASPTPPPQPPSPPPQPRRRPRKGATPKRRNRALEEVRKFSNSTNLLIPKLAFQRLVREIMYNHMSDARITGEALGALQESAEMSLASMFEDTLLCAIHAKRVTVSPKDVMLWKVMTRWFCSF